ncbi:hypothetical protein [Ligilactobacillus salivarius]|uniref:hypothetical protein n=1 Tax=Ligilactobacillus salivarius TaxID=1624 RepID=UPI001CFF6456|nr:hypothetical protein [Ligilactobacillus salivarius]UDE98110.1 hypothetical protein LG631_09215 [Ligilactobacillus salivarius]UUV97240.1 hypothetical protein M3M92_09225 [Ligilactobacillus salivarius]
MRIFDRFKKNKAERLEDNFQVRYIFSPDFDLENNKEIEKLYTKVVTAQDQRGELTLADTAPFATFAMIEELFNELRTYITETGTSIQFEDFAIWAYDKNKKYKLGKSGDDGNPFEFLTLADFELDYEYQNLSKVIFESIFNDPENEDFDYDEKLKICNEIKETYMMSTKKTEREIARLPSMDEAEKGTVILNVPMFSMQQSVKEQVPQYDPLTHTFSQTQTPQVEKTVETVSKKDNLEQQDQNVTKKETTNVNKKENITPPRNMNNARNSKNKLGKRTQHQQVQQRVDSEELYARKQGSIAIPQFEIQNVDNVEVGQKGYVEYKENEFKKNLNQRLKTIGSRINNENAKTILERRNSYQNLTKKAANKYISEHKSILDTLEQKVREEMLAKSNSEIETMKARLLEKQETDLAIAEQNYNQKVAAIKADYQDKIKAQSAEIRSTYEDKAYQKYNIEYKQKKNELNRASQKIWQENSKKFDIKLREDIAQLKMDSADTLSKLFKSYQDELEEYHNRILTENLNAKKIMIAEQQADNESKKVAAPYDEIQQKNKALATLNADYQAVLAERDSLLKSNQDLKTDNETLRRRNDQLADAQSKQVDLVSKKVDSMDTKQPDYFQQWMQIQMAQQVQSQSKQQDEKQEDVSDKDENINLKNSVKTARRLAASAFILLALMGSSAGYFAYHTVQTNNAKLASLDSQLSEAKKVSNKKSNVLTQDQVNKKAIQALHDNNLTALNKYSSETFYSLDKAIIEGKKDEVVKAIKSMDENNLNLQDRYRASLTESLLRQANQTSLADKVQEQNR